MKVRCQHIRISELPEVNTRKWLQEKYLTLDEDCPIGFERDSEYTVYGIHFWDNRPFYFLYESGYDCPELMYAGFFETIDPRISSYWRLKYKLPSKCYGAWSSLVHREWLEDELFYENLVEGEEKEVAQFKLQKSQMDEEFSSRGPQDPL